MKNKSPTKILALIIAVLFLFSNIPPAEAKSERAKKWRRIGGYALAAAGVLGIAALPSAIKNQRKVTSALISTGLGAGLGYALTRNKNRSTKTTAMTLGAIAGGGYSWLAAKRGNFLLKKITSPPKQRPLDPLKETPTAPLPIRKFNKPPPEDPKKRKDITIIDLPQTASQTPGSQKNTVVAESNNQYYGIPLGMGFDPKGTQEALWGEQKTKHMPSKRKTKKNLEPFEELLKRIRRIPITG